MIAILDRNLINNNQSITLYFYHALDLKNKTIKTVNKNGIFRYLPNTYYFHVPTSLLENIRNIFP